MKKIISHLILVLCFVACVSQTQKVTSYYETEKIAEQGTYKNGKRDDKWIFYYENGQKWKEVDYKRGIEIAIEKEWYENGQIKEKWNLINDETKHGKWISYYENGPIKEEEIYKNYEIENPADFRSKKGIIKKYKNQNGIWFNYYEKDRYGKWTSYYDNGQKKKEGNYKNGWKDGLWIEWHENGQKRVECRHKGTIIDPELGRSVHDGKFTVWTQDGLIKKEGNYINGVREWENVYDDPNSYTKVDTTK